MVKWKIIYAPEVKDYPVIINQLSSLNKHPHISSYLHMDEIILEIQNLAHLKK